MCCTRGIKLKNFFDIYKLYIKTFFKARMEYKISFILSLFSNFYCYFITYISYWVLISSIGDINGWNFSDLSILYGLSLLTYAISGTLIWYSIYHIEDLIITGQLDIMMLRPQGILKQLISQRFGDTCLGQIVVTVIFIVRAFFERNDGIGGGVIYLILAVIGGTFFQIGFLIFVGSLSFWTMRSHALVDIIYYDIRDMTQYPISIYPDFIKVILTFVVPWAFVNYYPTIVITDKVHTYWEGILGYCAPLIGIFVFIISVFFFKVSLRRYTSAGS